MLRLIPQLPWDSRYKLAVADDDDLADRALAAEDPDETRGAKTRPPPISEWNETQDLRRAILDGLASLEHTLIRVNTPRGKRVPELRRQPGPETAAMRARQRRKDAAMDELETRVTGGVPHQLH